MAGFGLKTPWARQPQIPTRINGGNSLAKGLIYAFNPVGGFILGDAAGRYQGTKVGTVTIEPTTAGMAAHPAGTAASIAQDYWYIPSAAISSLTQGSIAVLSKTTTLAPNGPSGGSGGPGFCFPLITAADSGTRNGFIFMLQNNTSKLQLQTYNGSGASCDVVGTTALNDSKFHMLSADWYQANGATNRVYVDGLQEGATANSSAWSFSIATGVMFGNSPDTFWGDYDGYMPFVGVWDRVLSPAEHKKLAENPWQIFQPIEHRIWVPNAGVSTYTLTAASGSFTLTGNATGLAASRKMTAAQASFTLTGNAASLVASRKMTAGTASFTLTGNDAALSAQRNITGGTGAFTLTGNNATLTYTSSGAYTMVAGTGSFSVNGNTVSLVYSGETQTRVGVGNGPAKRGRGRAKKQHVWLVEVDDSEYEVDDLEEVAPIVAKKIAKGKTPVVKAKPIVDDKRQAATAFTQQPWLTEYVPIPAYEKRLNFVDILPYILAMQEMDEEEELLLMAA